MDFGARRGQPGQKQIFYKPISTELGRVSSLRQERFEAQNKNEDEIERYTRSDWSKGCHLLPPTGGTQYVPQVCCIGYTVLLCTRTAQRTDTDTLNDGSRFAVTAEHSTRTLTLTRTQTL